MCVTFFNTKYFLLSQHAEATVSKPLTGWFPRESVNTKAPYHLRISAILTWQQCCEFGAGLFAFPTNCRWFKNNKKYINKRRFQSTHYIWHTRNYSVHFKLSASIIIEQFSNLADQKAKKKLNDFSLLVNFTNNWTQTASNIELSMKFCSRKTIFL